MNHFIRLVGVLELTFLQLAFFGRTVRRLRAATFFLHRVNRMNDLFGFLMAKQTNLFLVFDLLALEQLVDHLALVNLFDAFAVHFILR